MGLYSQGRFPSHVGWDDVFDQVLAVADANDVAAERKVHSVLAGARANSRAAGLHHRERSAQLRPLLFDEGKDGRGTFAASPGREAQQEDSSGSPPVGENDASEILVLGQRFRRRR